MSILRQKIQVANDPHRIRPNWFGLDCYPLRQIHKGLLVRHLLKGIVRVLEDRKKKCLLQVAHNVKFSMGVG